MDDCINICYDTYNIGRNYHRKNQSCIFDPIRKMLVIETPKEITRQKFIRYLIDELGVPNDKIEVDVSISAFKKGQRGTIDIVVYGENDGINYPLIIIQCKAPDEPLADEMWFEAYKYDEVLGVSLIIITNGDYTYAAEWDEDDGKYYFIEELPKYEQLLSDNDFEFVNNDLSEWIRPDFDKLLTGNTVEEFIELGLIGVDTDRELHHLIVNLTDFFRDTSAKCSPIEIDGINIMEDGLRSITIGNAAGGIFDGDYRYFILEDAMGDNQIVSMSIFGLLKCQNHKVFGSRSGLTTLAVAVDDFDKSHHSLQLNIDKYTSLKNNQYTIWHDGTLTIGKRGAAKRKEVIDFIRQQEPNLLDDNDTIILGHFNKDKEITWEQENIQKFISNLIRYSLLRDEFRKLKQD